MKSVAQQLTEKVATLRLAEKAMPWTRFSPKPRNTP